MSALKHLKKHSYAEAATTSAFRLLTSTTTITAIAITLKADHVSIGLIAAIPSLTRLSQLLSHPLANIFGFRRTTIFAAFMERLFLFACAPAALAGTHALPLVLLLFTLSQIFGSIYDGCMTVLYASTIPDSDQNSFYSIKQRWLSVSSLFFCVAGGLLINYLLGFIPPLFFYVSILAVTTLLSGTIFVTLQKFFTSRADVLKRPELPPPLSHTDSYPIQVDQKKPSFTDTPSWHKYLIFAALWGGAFGLTTRHTDTFTINHLGFALGTIAILAGFMSGAALFTSLFWGRLSAKFGANSSLTWALLIMLTNPIWFLLAPITSPYIVYLGSLIAGVGSAGHAITTPVWVTRANPSSGPSLYNIFVTVTGLAAGITPIIGGLFLDAFSYYGSGAAYMGLFSLTVIARLAAFLYFRTIKAPTEKGPSHIPRAAYLTSLHTINNLKINSRRHLRRYW